MTYDEQTLMAQAVKLAEMLICDDETLNADAKTFQRHSHMLAQRLRYVAGEYISADHSYVLVGGAEAAAFGTPHHAPLKSDALKPEGR